jgi:hypothetical protein
VLAKIAWYSKGHVTNRMAVTKVPHIKGLRSSGIISQSTTSRQFPASFPWNVRVQGGTCKVSPSLLAKFDLPIGGSYPELIDVNHFSSARGRVLPIFTNAERGDPKASLCSPTKTLLRQMRLDLSCPLTTNSLYFCHRLFRGGG